MRLDINKVLLQVSISIGIYVIIFAAYIEKLFFGGAKTIIDQGSILFFIAIAIIPKIVKSQRIEKNWIILFCTWTYFVFISLGENDLLKIIIQSILHLQLFIILISLNSVSKIINLSAQKILDRIAYITLFGILLNLLFPALFSSEIIRPSFDEFTRIEGFQLNANAAGILLALYIINLTSNYSFKEKKELILICLIAIILTGSRSALLILIVAFLFSNYSIKLKFLIWSFIFKGFLKNFNSLNLI